MDNIQKPVLDALQHAGVYHDDFQIVSLITDRMQPVQDGRIEVSITQVNDNQLHADPDPELESF